MADEPIKLTKTDFLLFMDCPLHLWAYKHDRNEDSGPAPFQLRLMAQGQEVEALAEGFITAHAGEGVLQGQAERADGAFTARPDYLLHIPGSNAVDVYEIKSSSSVKREHEYDLAFQALVCKAGLDVRDVYLVHVDKTYVRRGEIDPLTFFIAENMTGTVENRFEEVRLLRDQALAVARQETPDGLTGCTDPSTCPSLSLCHPDLPPHPIYDLSRIGKKALDLKEMGITAIEDIPEDFPLSAGQRAQIELVRSGRPKMDAGAIRKILDGLEYPLYFLDYETVSLAIPLFDGYHPYDLAVFQFSLHVVESPGAAPVSYEHLVLKASDPAAELAGALAEVLGPRGAVLVWNKSFEARCNKMMAGFTPAYAEFLEGVNERLFDLMEIFSKGLYQHPDFRGSASLKNVLPVLVPELTYTNLAVSDGTAAMQAWWDVVFGDLEEKDREEVVRALLEYCAQDTLAMVEIWKVLSGLVS